jgi:hypothetical protein
MFEMAGLAVTQAARGTGPRRYDAFVADPAEGRQIAELLCDGERILAWVLEDGVIAEPAEHRGRKPSNFRSRGLAEISPAAAEAILLLRRAVMAAKARGADIDQYPTAADVSPGGACFVFRPGVAELARRRYGSVSDFSAGLGPLPDARGAEP